MNAKEFKKKIESVTPKGDLSWYVKWIASIFIIIGMMLTSLDVSLFPVNLFFHLDWCQWLVCRRNVMAR